MASRMDELKELYDAYVEDENFSHLRKLGRKFVPGAGPLRARLMLIGEAPGRMENAKGLPFVGKAGTGLQNLLDDAGIDSQDVFFTNAVKYWPEGFRNGTGISYTPTEEEINASRSYILDEINLIEPLIVGMCGRTAIHTVFPGINDVRSHHGELLENKFVPLYHPAMLNYQKERKKTVREGYTKLAAYLTDKTAA